MGVGKNIDKRNREGQELSFSVYEKRKAGRDGIWDKGKTVTGPRGKRDRLDIDGNVDGEKGCGAGRKDAQGHLVMSVRWVHRFCMAFVVVAPYFRNNVPHPCQPSPFISSEMSRSINDAPAFIHQAPAPQRLRIN